MIFAAVVVTFLITTALMAWVLPARPARREITLADLNSELIEQVLEVHYRQVAHSPAMQRQWRSLLRQFSAARTLAKAHR